MICPYCVKEIREPNREHFYPNAVKPNSADFWACSDCNKNKSSKIIYPGPGLFQARVPDYIEDKFRDLWNKTSGERLLHIYPYVKFKRDVCGVESGGVRFTQQELDFYNLKEFRMVYDFSKELMHWDQKLFALAYSTLTYRYYLVHEYPFEFRIDCENLVSKSIDKYYPKEQDVLVLGSMKNRLWESVRNMKSNFERLYTWIGG